MAMRLRTKDVASTSLCPSLGRAARLMGALSILIIRRLTNPNPSLSLAVPLDQVQTIQDAIVSRMGGGIVSVVCTVPLLPVATRSAKRQTVNVWRRRSMIMMEIGLASSTTVRRCSPKAMRSEEDPKLAKLIPFDMLMKATGNMYPCPFMAAVLSAAVSHSVPGACLGTTVPASMTASAFTVRIGKQPGKLQKAIATSTRAGKNTTLANCKRRKQQHQDEG